MSRHSHYRAIDSGTRLVRRLHTDAGFHALLADLTLLGPGPFIYDVLDPSEIRESLESLVEQGIFVTFADAEATLADLRREIESAVAADPGLAERSAYLEQCHEQIEGDLTTALTARGENAIDSLVQTLLYGDEAIAPGLGFEGFRLVPSALVSRGAVLLDPLPARTLYPDRNDWHRLPAEDYAQWRSLYRTAAEFGHGVLVLTS